MRVVVHALGDSDLGVESNERIRAALAGLAFERDLRHQIAHLAAALDRRDEAEVRRLLLTPAASPDRGPRSHVPLQVMLRGFGPGDRLLLIATATSGNLTGLDTAPLAGLLARAFDLVPDVYGPVVPAFAVEQLVIAKPALDEGYDRLSGWLSAPGRLAGVSEIVAGVGTGATALAFGCLMAVLEAGPAVRVWPIQEAEHGRLVDIPVTNDPTAWLARRRMFGALAAAVDPVHTRTRRLLELLDARQRLDPGRFAALAELADVPVNGPLSPDRPEALADAFFDRLTRREVQATMIGRAWLLSRYNELRGGDDPSCEPREELSTFIRRVWRERGYRRHRSAAVTFLLDNEIINDAAQDNHTLRAPKPSYLAKAAQYAQGVHDRDPRRAEGSLRDLPGLPADLDPFVWVPAASGRVLVCYCVGTQERQGDDRPFADAVCDPAWRERIGALVDARTDGGARTSIVPVVRLVGSAPLGATPTAPGNAGTIGAARESARYIGEHLGLSPDSADWPDTVEVPLTISTARDLVRDALLAETSIFNVEAVLVLAGPGANQMNLGLLLAATDVAVTIGSPVYVGELVPAGDGRTAIRLAASQVAALPGYPHLLAGVAREHLADLEVSAAADLLRRGGRRLAPVAALAEELRRAFVDVHRGVVGVDAPAEVARRIELIRALLAGVGRSARPALDDWHALHLAMTMADAILYVRGGPKWYAGKPFGRAAYRLRSQAIVAHGDQLRSFTAALRDHPMPSGRTIRTCDALLRQVQRELDPRTDPRSPDRRRLVTRYEELRTALDELFPPLASAALVPAGPVPEHSGPSDPSVRIGASSGDEASPRPDDAVRA
ncbi:hypothetical protein I6A60_05945 [Frankia sp. AgB1.9]|uniref:hypothetical protein n=1 Tax=unclassified Frankia TaxID=2632575 RepID=UPI0019348402|nr:MULTISPECIES: hypothetical protein [unclassified Frankia]MBL7487460.1 hypothetical protein [Frankia sp. AgW1.1]MBL7547422.1 hypothetical protein [Frankia sp. AgB1.9]MBL7618803.1 hypothetical protein [Frankia sp. AgB1.8]